jgi:flap endonuclease-1
MGIRNLNKYLLQNCYHSIRDIHLSELKNKKISIDISIYLYHFERNGNLMNGIYDMLNIFKFYNIIPVFIFDGKPPNEKKYILQERKQIKEKNNEKIKELTDKINKLTNKINNLSKEENNLLEEEKNLLEEKNNILLNIEKLKRQTISITRDKIENVKNIIRMLGYTYYDAPQEADELCSILTIREQVWACMSEDMDMFIYGCPRIIRYFCIYKQHVKLYSIQDILYELNVSFNNFKQICILSGTDYNMCNNKYNLARSIHLFNQYQEYINIHTYEKSYSQLGFIEWIIQHIDSTLNYELLYKIYYMFDLTNKDKLIQFRNILIMNNL